MRTFEENLDAWLEGRLQGKELETFEASLPEISAAELEQQANDLKLGSLLKTQIGTPRMSNQEFFSHQISEAIARDEAKNAAPVAAKPARETWWSISRLVWAGATSLARALTTFDHLRHVVECKSTLTRTSSVLVTQLGLITSAAFGLHRTCARRDHCGRVPVG